MDRVRSALFFSLALLLLPSSGRAAAPTNGAVSQSVTALQSASQAKWTVIWSGDCVRQLIAGSVQMYGTDAVDAGRRFLEAHGGVVGLTDPATETRLRSVKQGKAITRLDYDQLYRGLRVIDGRLVLTVDGAGSVRSLCSSLQPLVGTSTRRSSTMIASEEAITAAMQGLRIQSVRSPASAERAIWSANGTPKEIWEVRIPASQPLGDFRVLVDAETGHLLRKWDFLCHADGVGLVFDPNPIVTMKDFTLCDLGNAPDAVPQEAYKTVTLRDIDSSGYLSGPYVNVIGVADRAWEPELKYLYDRSDSWFEQVMVYYHIDRSHRYLTSLGYDSVANFPLTAIANNHPEDQSFYSDYLRRVTFGTGGVDDAEDADIILHEYGHVIQHDQIPEFGSIDESICLGEGFADYWAFTNDTDGTFHHELIGEWDATSYSDTDPPYLRRVDEDLRYPDDLVGEFHEDGRIWSRSLYGIWNSLGKTVADTLVLESHFTLGPDASMFEGAQAIYEADRILYEGAHLEVLFRLFDQRGLAATTLSKTHINTLAGESVVVPYSRAILGGSAQFRWEQISGPFPLNFVVTDESLSFTAPEPPEGTLMSDLVFRLFAEQNGNPLSHNDLTVTVFGDGVLFDAPDNPVSIPDDYDKGVTRTVYFSGTGPVSQILLYVDVDHTYRGDLRVELTSPLGTRCTLVPASSKPGKDLEVLFYANKTTTDLTEIRSFLGEEAHGTWKLTITDTAEADTGTLQRWALGILTTDSVEPSPYPIRFRSDNVLYREQFEHTQLGDIGYLAYPGGFEKTSPAGTAALGTPGWADPSGRTGGSLVLSADPGEVITVILDSVKPVRTDTAVFLSVRVTSSGPGATVVAALVEQTFDGSIGYFSRIDSEVYRDSWSTIYAYFMPQSGGVLPILQIANCSGIDNVSVAFDDLTIYPVTITDE